MENILLASYTDPLQLLCIATSQSVDLTECVHGMHAASSGGYLDGKQQPFRLNLATLDHRQPVCTYG